MQKRFNKDFHNINQPSLFNYVNSCLIEEGGDTTNNNDNDPLVMVVPSFRFKFYSVTPRI